MHGRNQGPKIPLDKATLKRTLKYIFGTYPVQLGIVAVLIVISAVSMMQGMLFMQTLIDDYITPMLATGSRDFGPLAAAMTHLGVILGAGVLAQLGQSLIMVTVSQGTMERMRNDLFFHMQTLPISYFDTHERGDIMSVYTNDIDSMRQIISQTIPQTINSMITVVIAFTNMLRLSLPLTCMSLWMVGVQIFVAGKVGGLAARYFGQRQLDLGRENAFIEEMLEGQKVVKVFCHEEAAIADFQVLNNQLCASSTKANIFGNILMPINGNIGHIGYVLMAVVGGALAIGNIVPLSLGMLVTFLNLNRQFSMPITQISMQVNAVAMAMAGAGRMFRLMDAQPEQDEGRVELVNARTDENGQITETNERTGVWAWKYPHHDGTITYTPMAGEVTLENVDFSYVPEKQVLYDISLYGKPGQKIAFVGSTGAGKTTITNLLNRFYDIDGGKIRYDGINVSKIKKPALRSALGMVLQDTQLFTGTIMENIRYGRLDATDEECIAAAKLANADSFIRRLPDGYNTMLTSNGGTLSQGERQMLAIARAAVADPPVMILDEATSSIDTRTESLVQKAMDALMEGRTTFVIAHRLSTVRNSDCIMVMEQGRIIERGTHDELIEKKGRYYQLYTGNAPEPQEQSA